MAKDSQKSQSLNLTLWPAKAAILCIRAYQLIASPWLGNHCRFTPSCSHYAVEAYRQFGFFRGSFLTVKRLAKCNPWHQGGIDEIPQLKPKSVQDNRS